MRKMLNPNQCMGACFFAIVAGLSDSLAWAIAGLFPAAAALTAVRPVVLAAAVEYSQKSESTTLGVVFTALDGIGMFGALCAGLVAEFDLQYAFLLAAVLALIAAIVCLFLNIDTAESNTSLDQQWVANPVNPADP